MFPRWLSWLFVLFLAYIILTGNRGLIGHDPVAGDGTRETVSHQYPEINALVDGNRWKRAIHPDYRTQDTPCAALARVEGQVGSYAISETAGSGDPVRCGDTMQVSLQLWDANGKPQKPASDMQLTLSKQPGLDALLVGMTVGETRTVLMPIPRNGYRALPDLKHGSLQLFTVTRVREAASVKKDEPAAKKAAKEKPAPVVKPATKPVSKAKPVPEAADAPADSE